MSGYNFSIEFRNFDNLKSKLSGDVVGKASRDALDYARLFVESRGKENAPVRTGILRASITSTLLTSFEAKVGSNVEYAKFQEYGTSRGIKPRRFIGRALDELQSRALKLQEIVIGSIRSSLGF